MNFYENSKVLGVFRIRPLLLNSIKPPKDKVVGTSVCVCNEID